MRSSVGRIATKEQFYRLSKMGQLGNFLRTWDNLQELEKSGYEGWLTLRSRLPDSPFFTPEIHKKDLKGKLKELYGKGCDPKELKFGEIPTPGYPRVMNVEVMRDERYLCLLAAFDTSENLRHSLEKNGKSYEGLAAQQILRTYMNVEGYDELQEIWDQYPHCIVEMTVWRKPTGVRNHQTTFWEARDY